MGINCLECSMTSFSVYDIHFKWCEKCQKFHDAGYIKRMLSYYVIDHGPGDTANKHFQTGYYTGKMSKEDPELFQKILNSKEEFRKAFEALVALAKGIAQPIKYE